MKIILAEHAGFCFGVKRAIEMAEETAQKQKVICWGPLIHNRQETDRLEKMGIITGKEENPCAGTNGNEAVIIRTHGVGPGVITRLKEEGREVIDATCPHVKKAQSAAIEARQEGYRVIILGDKNHAEVRALQEWTDDTAIVVGSWHDLEGMELPERVAVMAQTTEKEARFHDLVSYLKEKAPQVKVLSTICAATQLRQNTALELARSVEMMVVVGGRHSSNTRKLSEVCRDVNSNTYLIEEAGELNPCWLEGKKTIGITAGASTPAWIIKEVIQKMENYMEQKESIGVEERKPDKDSQDELRIKTESTAAITTADEQAETVNTESSMGQEQVSEAEQKGEEESEVPQGEETLGQEEETRDLRSSDEQMQDQDIQDMHGQLDFRSYKPGDIVKGSVVKVSADEVLVDIGGKSEGIVPAEQFAHRRVDPRDYVLPGQEILVEVLKEDKEGNILLSYKRARLEEALSKLEEAREKGEIITAPVIQVVKGGLLVDAGIRGFVPASQVERFFVEDLNQYLNKELRLKVVELDRKNKKAVLSQRAVFEEEYQRQKDALWSELEEGQTRKGTVRRLANFGAFVDLGGIDGLLHVSEMGWGRINKPSDVVQEGDEIEVYVSRIDRSKGKVSLSLKGLLEDPWNKMLDKYRAGMVIEGTVVRTAPFGAFIELEKGIDGLAHISQLSTKRVNKVEDVVNVGQQVTAKITEVDPEKKRISLSLKDVVTDAEKAEYEKIMEHQPQDVVTIGEILKDNKEQ